MLAILLCLAVILSYSSQLMNPNRSHCSTYAPKYILSAPDGTHCQLEDDGTLPLAINTGSKRWRIIGLSCVRGTVSEEKIANISNPVVTGNGLALLSDRSFNHVVCYSVEGHNITGLGYTNENIYIKYIDLDTNQTQVETAGYVNYPGT